MFSSELELETSKLRKEHRDMILGKQELDCLQDEKILRIRELEKALRFSKTENDDLHRVSISTKSLPPPLVYLPLSMCPISICLHIATYHFRFIYLYLPIYQ